jgi:hypothetical protein
MKQEEKSNKTSKQQTINLTLTLFCTNFSSLFCRESTMDIDNVVDNENSETNLNEATENEQENKPVREEFLYNHYDEIFMFGLFYFIT